MKVVTAANGDALYFSRSRIPFDREGGDGEILGHIGLYAFRMGALERFVSLPQSPLEKRGKLEQLRFWKTASRSAWSAWKATKPTA